MTEFEPVDFDWISEALSCVKENGFTPDRIEVDGEDGTVKFVYDPAEWKEEGC